ncbi:MAG: hypothetical protein WB716_07075 [Candidatus Acidiferrales bacterium]
MAVRWLPAWTPPFAALSARASASGHFSSGPFYSALGFPIKGKFVAFYRGIAFAGTAENPQGFATIGAARPGGEFCFHISSTVATSTCSRYR